MAELQDGYRLVDRGQTLDLVHISREFIAGRLMTLREIVRSGISRAEALQEAKTDDR